MSPAVFDSVKAVKALTPFERAQWHSRVISFVHAVVALVLTGWALSLAPCWWCAESIVDLHSVPIELSLANICGYMAYDFVDILLTYRECGKMDGGPMIFAHHLLGVLSYFITWAYARCGFIYAVAIMCEISTPFLNGIFFAQKLDMPRRGLARLLSRQFTDQTMDISVDLKVRASCVASGAAPSSASDSS